MKEVLFYLRDTRQNVGSSCIFWRKNGAGYGSSLDESELFTLEKAKNIMDEMCHFVALEKNIVDQFCKRRVDMQYLLPVKESNDVFFYIQRNIGEYDGNDIYFETKGSCYSQNLDEAVYFPNFSNVLETMQDEPGIIWPKSFIDSISRRILPIENVSLKKMALDFGVKIKKQKKKKPTSGKTRHNCPQCGKITWSFNPYDAEYCYLHTY